MSSPSINSGASVATALIARARAEVADLGAPSPELTRDVAAAASQLSPAARDALLSTFMEAGWPRPIELEPPQTQHVAIGVTGSLSWSSSEPVAAPDLDQVRAGLATLAKGARDPAGSKDGPLHELQRKLNAALSGSSGFRPLTADGIFGLRTDLAVKVFQKRNGLRPTGEVDLATLTALDAAGGAAPEAKVIAAHDEGVAETVNEWLDLLAEQFDTVADDPNVPLEALLTLGEKPSTELMAAMLTGARDRFGPSAEVHGRAVYEGTSDEIRWLAVTLNPDTDVRRQAAVTKQIQGFMSRAITELRGATAKPGAELRHSEFVGHKPAASKLESIREAVTTGLGPQAQVVFSTVWQGTPNEATLATVSLRTAEK